MSQNFNPGIIRRSFHSYLQGKGSRGIQPTATLSFHALNVDEDGKILLILKSELSVHTRRPRTASRLWSALKKKHFFYLFFIHSRSSPRLIKARIKRKGFFSVLTTHLPVTMGIYVARSVQMIHTVNGKLI